jgi:hypothetical protein
LRLRIKFRSANAHIAFDVGGFQIDFFDLQRIFAGPPALGIALAASSPSIDFIMAGVADPPNLALNFTPFQFHGLWLDVTITPPAAPNFFTLKETVGVGT